MIKGPTVYRGNSEGLYVRTDTLFPLFLYSSSLPSTYSADHSRTSRWIFGPWAFLFSLGQLLSLLGRLIVLRCYCLWALLSFGFIVLPSIVLPSYCILFRALLLFFLIVLVPSRVVSFPSR